jgi:ribosomal peptide maturation radical SAM protein 1
MDNLVVHAEPGGHADTGTTTAAVALVNMPFAAADRPSIQCGLLKSALLRHGHKVDVFYLNLELAAEFGDKLYDQVSNLRTDLLLGEWLFSVAAFGYRANEAEYRSACPSVEEKCKTLEVSFEHLCELRNSAFPAWVAAWTEKIDWGAYDVVGFTSTFEQNTPAFALAQTIKARHPRVTILFGGANFDGDMGREYLRVLPFIDYAVIGEGDRALPQAVARIVRGESPLDIPGVYGRAGAGTTGTPSTSLVDDLDAVPDPDYDDYFATLFRLGRERVLGIKPPLLLIETARGCWWGEKQHCTFCGLNANGMRFRSKSAPAVVRQLRALSQKYKITSFEAVDNIMDHRYLDTLCDTLLQERNDYRLFYEVKANLQPAQLRLLARAGIRSIQPGIESLSSHILKLMRKGITMLRNVRLLKWAHYYGMFVGWNLLTGFPGETAEDYREQVQLLPLLRHLPPPQGTGPLWLERFSPYYFDRSFPVRNVRPLDVYRFVYPEGGPRLDQIAYFFHYEMDDIIADENHQELRELVRQWQEAWKKNPRPTLIYQRAPDWIQIVDRRGEAPTAHAFGRRQALIYEACGVSERTVEALSKELEAAGEPLDATEVREALAEFCSQGLMISEKDCYLSLAIPANPNW